MTSRQRCDTIAKKGKIWKSRLWDNVSGFWINVSTVVCLTYMYLTQCVYACKVSTRVYRPICIVIRIFLFSNSNTPIHVPTTLPERNPQSSPTSPQHLHRRPPCVMLKWCFQRLLTGRQPDHIGIWTGAEGVGIHSFLLIQQKSVERLYQTPITASRICPKHLTQTSQQPPPNALPAQKTTLLNHLQHNYVTGRRVVQHGGLRLVPAASICEPAGWMNLLGVQIMASLQSGLCRAAASGACLSTPSDSHPSQHSSRRLQARAPLRRELGSSCGRSCPSLSSTRRIAPWYLTSILLSHLGGLTVTSGNWIVSFIRGFIRCS